MRKSAVATIGVVILVIIAGVLVVATTRKSKDSADTATSSAPNTTASPENTTPGTSTGNGSADEEVASTILYDGSSFTLSAKTIKAGSTVKVTNTSNNQLDFDSDPHPVHTDNTELNVGDIGPGESKTFTINKTGTWGFHNHLNSSQKGSITVE